MDSLPLVLALLIATVILGGVVAVYALKQRRTMPARPTDYRGLFVVGIVLLVSCGIFLVVAAVLDMSWAIAMPLFIIGIVYAALGWSHRAEWTHR